MAKILQWLRQERNAHKLPVLWQAMGRKLRGHFNYFGVTDNSRALYSFERAVQKLLFKWLNRRSQQPSFTWETFRCYLARKVSQSQVAWYHAIRFGKRSNEEACAGKPQAGFCEGGG